MNIPHFYENHVGRFSLSEDSLHTHVDKIRREIWPLTFRGPTTFSPHIKLIILYMRPRQKSLSTSSCMNWTLSITCVAVYSGSTFCPCIRRVQTKWHFYWRPSLINWTKYEKLPGKEQGRNPSRTLRTSAVTEDPPIGKLVFGDATASTPWWTLWERCT